MNYTNSPLTCYLCGSSDCIKIHDTIRYNLPPKPYQCRRCGLVFLHPQMSQKEGEQFYKQEYRSLYVKEPPEEHWQTSFQEMQMRVDRFKPLISADSKILELGCASGSFLFLLKNLVTYAAGVEITRDYIDFGRKNGLTIKESIDEFPDRQFDVIFMFHFLEHINDPISYLKTVIPKLKADGKLIIEVPNIDDILVSVYKISKHLDFYYEMPHIFYYSKHTLTRILDSAGLDCQIFPHQRYDLSNHIYWMLYGIPGGKGYFNKYFSPYLLEEYEKSLKDRFICDTIYAVATRKKG